MGLNPEGFAFRVDAAQRVCSLPADEVIAKAMLLGARFEPYTNVYGESFVRLRLNGEYRGGWNSTERAAIAALLVLEQLSP